MGRTSDTGEDSRYPPGFAEALGRTIKVFRTDRGMERRELAQAVGISYSYLTEIENGNKPPSSSVLGPIASALGLRMSQLIEAAEARMESRTARPWGTDASHSAVEQAAVSQAGLPAVPVPPPLPAAAAPSAGAPAMPAPIAPASAPSAAAANAREHALRTGLYWRTLGTPDQAVAMKPSLRGADRDLRPALIELERLLRGMAPEDIERLLDFARRLAR